MKIYCTEDYDSMSFKAASLIAAQILLKPDSVLGLATGSTVLGIYHLISQWCADGVVSFAEIHSFNLDEYIGLAPGDPQSYHAYMRANLFDNIDAEPGNFYLPDGCADSAEEECRKYDELITSLGGIDLLLLGIGRNAHIGFNEPADAFSVPTHVTALAEETRRANARNFPSPEAVPREAITMGIGSIFSAKKILLVANGKDKAEAIRKAFTGSVTPQVPASILQLHPNVTLVGEMAALSELGV